MFGSIATDELAVFGGFHQRAHVAGATVVEIGGALPAATVHGAEIAQWIAVDPVNEPDGGSGDRYWSVQGSGAVIPLADATADYAFSSNAFEHIRDLEGTLREVARVLKPGGFFYAHFGPIWSAPDGHHLEATVDGITYNFWEHHIVPPWAHLALSEQELGDVLAHNVPRAVARELAHWIHHDSYLNRLCFEDYLHLFANGVLNLVHLETSPAIDYMSGVEANWTTFGESARERLGTHRDLRTRDMLAILRRT